MNTIYFVRTINGAYFFKMAFFARVNNQEALDIGAAAHPKYLNTHAFSASKALLFVQVKPIHIHE